VRTGQIQVLVVARYDRFSRVQLQQAAAIYQIEQVYGGRVESADPKEQFGQDSTGVLLRSVNAWRAEQELELIRERTQGSRQSRAKSGKLIAAPFPLFGYLWSGPGERRGKSRYLLDPETAPIVARIYGATATGVPIRQIAPSLSRDGVPTPAHVRLARGLIQATRFRTYGTWSRTMIQRIASNPAYAGAYVAYRTQTTIQHERDESGGQPRLRPRTRLRPCDDPATTLRRPGANRPPGRHLPGHRRT
jgi:hypothetical protein